MHIIEFNSNIEELWHLLSDRPTVSNPNSIVGVILDGKLIGIITDGDIRKYISKNMSLPKSIGDITRPDFMTIKQDRNKMTMARNLSQQISKRGWSTTSPINDVIVQSNSGEFNRYTLVDFSEELEIIRDEYIIWGMGYVGLTLMAVLNHIGLGVIGIEKDLERLERLKLRDFYVREPKLNEYFSSGSQGEFYSSLPKLNQIVESKTQDRTNRRIHIIAVNTPYKIDDGLPTSDISEVITSISQDLVQGDIIILRSTIPVGTTEMVARQIESLTRFVCGVDFFLGFAPERTVEGNAIYEIQTLPQIVSGQTEACLLRVRNVVEKWAPSVLTASSPRAAEMAKLANNAYRDYTFAFSNELALHAMNAEVDINEVIEIANRGYARSTIPTPSPGVGGPCLTKDSYILHQSTTSNKFLEPEYLLENSTIIKARRLNEMMPRLSVEKFCRDLQELEISSKQVILIGIAFKGYPLTNDMRNSPAIEMAYEFKKKEFSIRAWDSQADFTTFNKSMSDTAGIADVSEEIVVIGNNFSGNLEYLNSLLSKSDVRVIFDPYEIIDSSNAAHDYFEKGIAVCGMTKMRKGRAR